MQITDHPESTKAKVEREEASEEAERLRSPCRSWNQLQCDIYLSFLQDVAIHLNANVQLWHILGIKSAEAGSSTGNFRKLLNIQYPCAKELSNTFKCQNKPQLSLCSAMNLLAICHFLKKAWVKFWVFKWFLLSCLLTKKRSSLTIYIQDIN